MYEVRYRLFEHLQALGLHHHVTTNTGDAVYRIDVTRADRTPIASFTGTVYVTTFGGTIACTYEVDDKHVIVKGPRGSQVLLLDGERLEGGLGAVFVKQ